jgi:hypothetical protein
MKEHRPQVDWPKPAPDRVANTLPVREERLKQPGEYFCVSYTDAPTDYFWGDIKVTKEEYLAARPDDPCD